MRIQVAAAYTDAYQNVIVQPVWDTQQFGSVTTIPTQIPYFTQTNQTVYGVSKTLVDTNMPNQGFFPAPDTYFLTGLMFDLVGRFPLNAGYNLTDISDMQRVLETGYLTVTIGTGQTKLVEGHCKLFPSGLGLQGMVTTGGATASNVSYIVGNGIRDIQNAFGLTGDFAEKINPNEKFAGNISWPSGVPVLSNSFSGRIYMRGLWGQSVR